MTIYADVIFILNFIASLAMLYLFSAFAELERKKLRLIAAASAGGIIALIQFCTSVPFIQLTEIAIPFIAFSKISIKHAAVFIIMKFITAGIVVLVVSAFGGSSAVIRGGIIYLNISPLLFLIIFIIIYPLFTVAMKIIKHKKSRRIYRLVINGTTLLALYDSGNLLRNPYDHSAVVIAENGSIDFDENNGFMLIPYRALNHSSMLKAFKVESVFCIEKNIEIKNVTIGISENALSETGRYNALIGPEIFKE